MLSLAVVGAFLLVVVTQRVSAETTQLSSEQQQQIKSNCQTIKSTLNQLHVSDALLRVNRGQFYESLATKLMDRFNSRLSSNGIDVVGFTAITNRYRTSLNSFRSDYQSYENQLANAIEIDCVASPQSFHDTVQAAREKRFTVHDDIKSLNQAITDYQNAVNTFADQYKTVTSGGND